VFSQVRRDRQLPPKFTGWIDESSSNDYRLSLRVFATSTTTTTSLALREVKVASTRDEYLFDRFVHADEKVSPSRENADAQTMATMVRAIERTTR